MNHLDHAACADPSLCPTSPADDAFASTVHACADDLYHYAYWLCLDPSRAEGLVIETFSRAPASLFDADGEHAVRCQLFSLLRRAHGEVGATRTPEPRERRAPASGAHDGSDDEVATLRERMRKLPRQEVEPLVLQALSFSVDEIARILGATPRCVASHLRHARAHIAPSHR